MSTTERHDEQTDPDTLTIVDQFGDLDDGDANGIELDDSGDD